MKSATEFWKRWAPHIPTVACASGCHGGCCGPILARQKEVHEIRRHCDEHGIQTQQPIIGDKIQCGFLRATGCAIYEVRPLICRVFGVGPMVVEKLRCPFLPLAPAMPMGLYLEMMAEYDRLGELVSLEGEEAWKRWCAEADSEKPII